MPDTILVCDDEELIRWSLCEYLQQEGFETVEASNGKECVDKVRTQAPTLVLMDLKMPVMDGLTALRTLRESDNDLPVVMITAHGGVESAIEATRLGAADYIAKPFDLREVLLIVKRAISSYALRREVHYLRDRDRGGYGQIVGSAPAMQRVFDTLRRLESIDAPTVLIQGESGSGKEVVARTIHARGPRKGGPF
ncbi:MAG TPA: response regulator, partial [Myxococcota bacterium]|nr:response regulator [Myxococcota bacterium]